MKSSSHTDAASEGGGSSSSSRLPDHKLYPIDANGIELMLGGMASAMALVSPRKSLNIYDNPVKYLTVTATVLFGYYAILAFAGIYCFKAPTSRRRPTPAGTRITAVIYMGVATLAASLVISIGLVLFGAPFASQHAETFMAALNMALLGVTPAILTLKPSPEAWRKALISGEPKSVPELWAAGLFWSTFVASWAAAYFIPLDWDRPWQKWPIPIVGGAFLGNLAGLLYVLLRCFILPLARADYAETERSKRDMVRELSEPSAAKKEL
ncbi:Glycosylphosphatidylinositol (GPI) anchor assembly protein [Coemansia sp. RSA 455]|nr:Glycosylphosphatidylinositol (GPI) anchor assembly protein [Coemansia sp. S3946]KAJ2042277.1 Glycosylphosphatidylinositol (GPI) anchor assembly protein [Coemansia sp. S16]KAJ2067933.1 Glycosylphosphatidylinositol (GPI) anchor assembly protein [Coemansia sp. S2]KAJ2072766.1 Glycosylphosphatidylinositol (GPI) anchor assembly protein [Coemansia sp. S155-1]KAJ2246792.1 Glycosylphosphatidylinositol (GPI) anchor assembly protein [Coemansia sp. RSA 455]KAJ2469622.1 Glycosylphosphatidylinositol (GP